MKLTGHLKLVLLSFGLFYCASMLYSAEDRLLAFPTAEGFGKYSVGGRGGNVYEVTTLEDGGAGSLREALGKPGPRTIVFRISGTIDLKSELSARDHTTIAGQTAPGDGICLKRYPLALKGDHIIVRYLKVRFGDESGRALDAVGGRGKNMIVDHVSASWSVDETLSIYHGDSVTVQWCMMTESLYESNHKGGNHHGFGGIWGGPHTTYHHNLLAHHSARSPRLSGATEDLDIRNNVIYNWGYNSMYGGEKVQNGDNGKTWKYSFVNVVANYYKPGPATLKNVRKRIVGPQNKGGWGKFYVTDNYMHGEPGITADNWSGGVQGGGDGVKSNEPAAHIPIKQHTAEEAYELVLAHAGASLPKRDVIDARIAQEVKDGNATYGKGSGYGNTHKIGEPSGIIDSQNEVGGWPELKSLPAPADGDHDGMPDEWEKAKGLNPADAEDRNGIGEGGYTNLENYLNSLVTGDISSAVKEETSKNKLELSHGYLNPFNSSPTIKYALPAKSNVKLAVFDAAGKIVATLVDEVKAPGEYSVQFDGSRLTTGLYLCKLSAANQSIAKKMFLLN